jgi:hypothetical protein
MTSDATLPAAVITGLAAGIGFIVLFSVMLKPDFMLSDEELVAKYNKLAEVKYFLEKHPDAKAEVTRSPNDNYLAISYRIEGQVAPPSQLYTGVNVFGIDVYAKPNHLSLGIFCGVYHGVTIGWGLADIASIDEAEKNCFPVSENEGIFEPHPDDDLMGGVFLSNSNEVISLHKGCSLSPVCHAHSIFIYGNGTAIHREYDVEGDRIYIFQIPQDETAELFQQFHETDLSMPKTDTFRGTDIVYYEMSFTANGKTTKVFYRDAPPTPQTILDLDLQIEQLAEKYDDRIVDCTEDSLTDCHVRQPVEQTQSDGDEETGLLEPETEVGEPIPVEVEILVDNETSIEITYTED